MTSNTKEHKLMTLQEAMSENGLGSPEVIIDGNLHRFKANNDKQKNSWYIGIDYGDFQAGSFGCWKRGINKIFCSKRLNKKTKRSIKTTGIKND